MIEKVVVVIVIIKDFVLQIIANILILHNSHLRIPYIYLFYNLSMLYLHSIITELN